MATATYTASLITRKASSSSNAKTGYACQEYYTNTYNYVGIICFSGMALTNKVITGISITAVSQQAGYGAGHTKMKALPAPAPSTAKASSRWLPMHWQARSTSL